MQVDQKLESPRKDELADGEEDDRRDEDHV